MADQIKYVDSIRLQYVLGKLRDKNAELFLGKMAEAASAAKVKNALTINGEAFDGSEAKAFNLSETGHKHVAADITDFTGAVQKVISDAGGTSHTHSNLATLEKIGEDSLTTWNNKIGANDVDKLKYSNVGMSGVADVKGALDILVKNAQINTAALTDTSANMNSLATKLTTAEGNISTAQEDIAALETAVGDAESGLTKKVADLEAANAEGGTVANAIKAAKDAADAAAAAVVTEKERAQGIEQGLQSSIDAINNTETGILAQAKDYTDTREGVLDGKITTAQNAANAAQADVDALEGVVGSAGDTADKTTVFGKIAKAQAQADKGVQDAATEKSRAEGVEAGLRTDLGQATDAAKADGSAFARIAQVKADLTAEANRAIGIEQGLRTDVDAAQDAIDVLNGGVDQEGSVDKKIADKISEVNTAAGNLEKRVKANEDAIAVINGEGEGSIKDAVAKLVNGAPEAMDTLNELANAITEHESTYQAYVAQVAKDIAAAKQEAITEAGKLDTALHNTITGEIATAKSEAISAAASDAASKDEALENKLQGNIDKKVDQSVYDTKVAALEKADTDNLAAAKKYADDEDAKIEAVIGTADDLATANTLYGKIKALQEKDASQDTEIGKKAAATDLDALEALVGEATDTKDNDTVFGKIAAEAGRATAAEGALSGRLDTAESKITALETTVGNAESGLVKDVANLKTTVGSDASGLVKDVADLKTKDTALDGEIAALKAKDTALVNEDTRLAGLINTNAENIATNTGDITDLKGTVSGHTTSINSLNQFMNSHGTITEEEIDAMMNTVYGIQA